MARLQAVYYRDGSGGEPVREFINALEDNAQAALLLQIGRLNMLADTDPPLPFPHSSQIEGELRELRCHFGRHLVRILYRRSEALFVLLHSFSKRTGALPEADKAIAMARWEDFRRRMDERPRRPPRAAGHDAP
jgi:phage-related protein